MQSLTREKTKENTKIITEGEVRPHAPFSKRLITINVVFEGLKCSKLRKSGPQRSNTAPILLIPHRRFPLEKLMVTQSRNSPPFMESEGPLLCSQQSAAGPHNEPDEPVHTFPPYFLNIHWDISFPSTHRSSDWSLPLRF